MADKNKSFDLILEELESIVESMDDGSLKLEETIDSYERGITLIKQAQQSLQAFEKKIKILNEQNELKDFDEPN
ncbi:MAG: exodeoxyribonuclease VII small subunit [Proteobacteria bacterium]|nr:exodeoxyribonuclease VII small subunit [Pseudomonadota bacterium]MDA0941897.1 exodeoxyribonuclease VII small subunit [Pseudomonadota bacterium]MDA1034742.1 exodeoxyribonuclease VII small subunit [Pseudomonadota bacterium]